MIESLNVPLAVCYPPGTGGSFVASALNNALFNKPFTISPRGNCHGNHLFRSQHIVPFTDIRGQREELSTIEKLNFPSTSKWVLAGHIRNLVALQSLRYDLWFIKITHDTNNVIECEALHNLLANKVDLTSALANVYDQVKCSSWPDTFDEFKLSGCANQLFKSSNMHTMQNWFWVENKSTRSRTIELSVQDIFSGLISQKLCQWFDLSITKKIDSLQTLYQQENAKLFPENTLTIRSDK